MKMKYLDNGFYTISAAGAKKLSGGRLPKHGHEKLVLHAGKHYWLARTPHQGKMVWSVRETNWKLKNDIAVL